MPTPLPRTSRRRCATGRISRPALVGAVLAALAATLLGSRLDWGIVHGTVQAADLARPAAAAAPAAQPSATWAATPPAETFHGGARLDGLEREADPSARAVGAYER